MIITGEILIIIDSTIFTSFHYYFRGFKPLKTSFSIIFYVYIIEKRGSFHIISNRGFDIEIDDMKINIRKRSSDKNVMDRINPIIDEIIADMSFYNDIDVVL